MKNELLPKIWVFWANLDEVCHPQSWRVTWGHFWEISLFSMEQAMYNVEGDIFETILMLQNRSEDAKE